MLRWRFISYSVARVSPQMKQRYASGWPGPPLGTCGQHKAHGTTATARPWGSLKGGVTAEGGDVPPEDNPISELGRGTTVL